MGRLYSFSVWSFGPACFFFIQFADLYLQLPHFVEKFTEDMKKIISIYGPTSVGKTTTVKELERIIGADKCTRISLDKYLKDKPEYVDKLTFLKSDPIDWELILSQIALPVGTKVKRLLYNHDIYKRVGIDEDHLCVMRDLIIIDGAWPFLKADVKIQLTLDSLIRFRRLILRYFNEWNEKGKVWIKFAAENWDQLPGVYVDINADLTIDTSVPVEENVSKILAVLNQ
jgi:uridine kinase